MSAIAPLNLHRHDILAALLIIILAFGLRVIVLTDRAHNDPQFQPLPLGSDQRTYVASAEAYEAGRFPFSPFRYQPGFIYFLVGVRALVGTNLFVDHLVLVLADSLACGLMIGVGWLLTRRRWGGILTGLIYALYPVAIFYSTEFLLEGMALFYICLFLFLTLWQRERLSLGRSALIGLVLGLVTITRTNLALLLLAWLLWLALIEPQRRRVFLHGAVSLLTLALAIAPVTLWNFQMGSRQLITNVGMEEIYRASSRDSDGTYIAPYNAHHMVESDYFRALVADIRSDPLHFAAIQVRKFGLYWSDAEPANNIDYYANGEAVSPLLSAIPLDFRILSALGLLGTVILWRTQRRAGWFFAAVHLLIFAGVMVIWVASRVRLPAVAPLVATSGCLIVWLVDAIRAREWRKLARQALPAAAVIATLLVFCSWAIDHALVKHPLAALPSDAQPDGTVFDDTLELVGWRWLEDWPSGERGWAQPEQSYGIELFWQVLQPTANDYNTYVAYIQEGIRYAAQDAVIGMVSRPFLPTSQWKAGEIYREIMGFKFPWNIPAAQTGQIHLGVYLAEGELTSLHRTVQNVQITSDPQATSDLIVQNLAVYMPDMQPEPIIPDLQAASLVFGGEIALTGMKLPETATPGSRIELGLAWQALNDPLTDYTLFVHVMDANDQLQASYDAPVGGTLLSSNWKPGYPVYEYIPLTLPSMPGAYRVYIGLYHPITHERLAVDAADYRPLLGEITIAS